MRVQLAGVDRDRVRGEQRPKTGFLQSLFSGKECTHTHTHTESERERERKRDFLLENCLQVLLRCIHVHLYTDGCALCCIRKVPHCIIGV